MNRREKLQVRDALFEVFCIGDRLLADVYGGEFVPKLKAAIVIVDADLARVVEPVGNKPLLLAAIACGHEIEHDKVTMYFDPEKPGHNALHQLAIRLDAAQITPQEAAAPELTDAAILRLVDTHVGGPNPSYPLDNSDWINFARAVIHAQRATVNA